LKRTKYVHKSMHEVATVWYKVVIKVGSQAVFCNVRVCHLVSVFSSAGLLRTHQTTGKHHSAKTKTSDFSSRIFLPSHFGSHASTCGVGLAELGLRSWACGVGLAEDRRARSDAPYLL